MRHCGEKVAIRKRNIQEYTMVFRRFYSLVGILSVLVLATTTNTALADEDTKAQRERIIASRNERRIQLEERIEANNKKIEDHHAGIAVLNDNQLQHLMRRNDAFIHQVEHMAKELDEEEIQRKIEAEKKRRKFLEERNKHQEL